MDAKSAAVSDETVVRLHTHRRNIERYQRLLESKLNDAEKQYLEERLFEERTAIETQNFASFGTMPSGRL